MEWLFPFFFWLSWIGVPAFWVGYHHRSRLRALTVAVMVVLVPYGLTLVLDAWGGPADPADAAELNAWLSRCVDLGVPAGYALGILMSFAGFRYLDRGAQRSRDPRTVPLHDRCLADRPGGGEHCAEINPPARI